MKKAFLPLILALTFVACKHVPTAKEATTYNDKLMEIEKKVVHKQEALNETFGSSEKPASDKATMEKAQKDLLDEAKKAKEEGEKLGAFDGSREFLDGTLKYIDTHRQLGENEYGELIKLYSKPVDPSANEADTDRINKIIDAIGKKLDSSYKEFILSCDKFAEKYKLVRK